MTAEHLVEALTYGQVPSGALPVSYYPAHGLVGATGDAPSGGGAGQAADKDIYPGNFVRRSAARAEQRRRRDDDEVLSVVMSLLDARAT